MHLSMLIEEAFNEIYLDEAASKNYRKKLKAKREKKKAKKEAAQISQEYNVDKIEAKRLKKIHEKKDKSVAASPSQGNKNFGVLVGDPYLRNVPVVFDPRVGARAQVVADGAMEQPYVPNFKLRGKPQEVKEFKMAGVPAVINNMGALTPVAPVKVKMGAPKMNVAAGRAGGAGGAGRAGGDVLTKAAMYGIPAAAAVGLAYANKDELEQYYAPYVDQAKNLFGQAKEYVGQLADQIADQIPGIF